ALSREPAPLRVANSGALPERRGVHLPRYHGAPCPDAPTRRAAGSRVRSDNRPLEPPLLGTSRSRPAPRELPGVTDRDQEDRAGCGRANSPAPLEVSALGS